MAIVVKWRADGEYFVRRKARTGEAVWSKNQAEATRFASVSDAKARLRDVFGCAVVWRSSEIKFVRLVPRKR